LTLRLLRQRLSFSPFALLRAMGPSIGIAGAAAALAWAVAVGCRAMAWPAVATLLAVTGTILITSATLALNSGHPAGEEWRRWRQARRPTASAD
jgi:hypothetical protein